jgi:hypothetical protein
MELGRDAWRCHNGTRRQSGPGHSSGYAEMPASARRGRGTVLGEVPMRPDESLALPDRTNGVDK